MTDMINNTTMRMKQDRIKFNRSLSHDSSVPHSGTEICSSSLSIPYALDEQRQLSMVINSDIYQQQGRLTTIKTNSGSKTTPCISHIKSAFVSYNNNVIISVLSHQTPRRLVLTVLRQRRPRLSEHPDVRSDLIPPNPPRSRNRPAPVPPAPPRKPANPRAPTITRDHTRTITKRWK